MYREPSLTVVLSAHTHPHTRTHTHAGGQAAAPSKLLPVPLGCWPCRSGTCCLAKCITMLARVDLRSDTSHTHLPARGLLARSDTPKSKTKEFCFPPSGSQSQPPHPNPPQPSSLLHYLSPLLAPLGSWYHNRFFLIITAHTVIRSDACVFSSVCLTGKLATSL